MFGNVSNLVITGVISGDSTPRAQVKKRGSHLLIYKLSGKSVYYLRGAQITITPGSVLYVPEGETYEFEKISEGESLYYLVNFHADFDKIVPPMIICNDKNEKILKTFKEMEKRWRALELNEEKYETISLFYHLVALLADSKNNRYVTQKQKNRIEPAITYLSEHLGDTELKTSELAKLCNMSEVIFRKLFNIRFGVSPKKYIIQGRMQIAKAMLENGEYESISQVAREVGYDDSLHFSKSFKKVYGVSPTKM